MNWISHRGLCLEFYLDISKSKSRIGWCSMSSESHIGQIEWVDLVITPVRIRPVIFNFRRWTQSPSCWPTRISSQWSGDLWINSVCHAELVLHLSGYDRCRTSTTNCFRARARLWRMVSTGRWQWSACRLRISATIQEHARFRRDISCWHNMKITFAKINKLSVELELIGERLLRHRSLFEAGIPEID